MSVNPEALQKLLMEMNAQIQQNQADYQLVQQQIDRHSTNSQIATLTIQELEDNGSANGLVWEGVGKMFIAKKVDEYKDQMAKDKKLLDDQVKNLNVRKDYLKTSIEKTSKTMQSIIQGKPIE
ncbi:hypothetical protein WICPIJ_005044 [Wickerhamomyces pijperi]|uniref:Prefoldin subunit 1 n=1 Tax=Wickerhamomyces pijperi TaxID=599730 RepID=A0A9P8Q6Y6_WICPI|nr:hypothetical protein WICPIJ_005044 [Wickerhamomyces pijperi]